MNGNRIQVCITDAKGAPRNVFYAAAGLGYNMRKVQLYELFIRHKCYTNFHFIQNSTVALFWKKLLEIFNLISGFTLQSVGAISENWDINAAILAKIWRF